MQQKSHKKTFMSTLLLVSQKNSSVQPDKNKQNNQQTPGPITIWIHGTKLSKHLLPRFSYTLPGLHHYTKTHQKYYIRTISETLIASDPEQFNPDTFYLYGWNGNLSRIEREKAAHQLYQQLKIIRQDYYKKYGVKPYIQILSHSHGGNVALLLAKVKDPADVDFSIDRLVLLACPVQLGTKELITDDIFKKVYSLYSTLDLLQVADPQGLKNKSAPLFSQRLFDPCNKLTQTHMKIYGRSFRHLDFIMRRFLCNIARVLQAIDQIDQKGNQYYRHWHKTEKILCLENIKKS